MRRAIVVAAALLLARTAHADSSWLANPDGEAWLHYELTDVQRLTRTPGDVDNVLLAGLRLHGLVARHGRLALHAGFDLAAGSTIDRGGFAYDVALYPLGVGVLIGDASFVALGTGVAALGATRSIDDGVGVPLEATVELGHGTARLLGRARAVWLAGTRDPTAPSLPVGQELDAMLGLRIGHHENSFGYPIGDGYFVAVAYKEIVGARYVGLTVGYSIDAGARGRRRTVLE